MPYFKKINFFFITSLFLVCSSCDTSSETDALHMAFDNVEFVSDFPLKVTLDNPLKPETNNVGLRRFRIIDSLMILDKPGRAGFWEIYQLPNYEKLGAFLNKGDGPLEFMQSPSVSNKNSFKYENDELIAYLYDFQKGRIMRFNISASVESEQLKLSQIDASLPPYSFAFSYIDQDTYFLKEIKNKDTQQNRFLLKDGKRMITSEMEKLNSVGIKEGEDFNMLSTISSYSDKHDMIVEVPIGLNNINIYKLDGSFAKSICVGEELSDINEIQDEDRWARIYTFADLRLFDDFFGVVFIDEDEKTYQLERRKKPSILLFDWEGKPLAQIKTDNFFSSFDIDLNNQELYTFDLQTDEFLKYDIEEPLNSIQKELN